jgi:small subunit ribosomal protein S20
VRTDTRHSLKRSRSVAKSNISRPSGRLSEVAEIAPELPVALRLRYPESSKMANTYSALKRVRQTERRTEYNRRNKTRLRHQIRAMRRAINSKDAKAAADLIPKTFSLIDRSAKIGIIKQNTAARYKSNLHVKVKALAG